jgi:hypothetical protein
MRGYFGLGQLSAAEKSDILDQHKSVYNGYQTMQPQVSNTQPLTVYDFAGDKEGLVVNNKGEVKKYTNMGINEQVETKEVCDDCGAMIMDGMCTECNYGHMEESYLEEGNMCEQCGGTMKEDVCEQCGSGKMEEETGHLDDIYKVRDLNLKKGDYDYVEGGGNDYGTFEGMHKNLYKEQDSYDYKDRSMYDPYYGDDDDDFMDYESSYTEDGMDDPDNEDDGYEDMNASEVTDGEMDEIDIKDLVKGKKYRYKSPSHQDDVEFGDEREYHDGKNMYGFKGGDTGYSLGKRGVEDFINNLDDEDEELYEQGFTGGGNAPDMDLSNIDPGYDFESDGPDQFQKSSDNLDVEDEDEESETPAFDFESGGPNSGYPVFEDDMYGYDPEKDYETMESAWDDDEGELDEQPDISGAQGIYGAMKKAYDFDSDGPGKGGPYQEFSYESELDEEDEFEEVDEDLKESLINQKNKIIEMFNRIKKYN